ncbi:MAG: UDP-2,3-diacylglucosamine diphosphatase [Bacteroidota bacterium]
MKRKLDLVVISDTHLGTYGCHARECYQYLCSIQPRTLILNGDFIDMWQFRKRYFPKEHMQVIQQVLRMAAQGTKVYYITGNHDDVLRRYSDFSTGNIHLRDKLVLQLKNKRLWIFHGDVFDLSVRYSPWIAKLGSKSYDYLILLNRFINKVRVKLGWNPMSLAGKVKRRVKEAVKFISDFETTAIKMASEQAYDYVICGHIHLPQMRSIMTGTQTVTYLNSGDWVENLTALEYQYGQWSIYRYDEADYQTINKRLIVDHYAQEEQQEAVAQFNPEELLEQIVGQKVKGW